jgi:pimeloyl-ACP methyl ester carboxylesterase
MAERIDPDATPVQIIAGGRDSAVPPVNAEFLHERLPQGRRRARDFEDDRGQRVVL